MWIQTTPTPEESKILPPVGSKWINKKIERAIAKGRNVPEKRKKGLVIVIAGANIRDDESEGSLQVSWWFEADTNKVLYMTALQKFYEKYRLLNPVS